MLRDPVLHEVFTLYAAWGVLVDHLIADGDAKTVSPGDVHGRACAADRPRLIALFYAHGHGESMLEAEELLGELLALAAQGRRPRYGTECGITSRDIAGES